MEPSMSRRRISDDVASLDSWSEAISADNSPKTPTDKGRENEVLLNPRRLQTIAEPPEPRVVRVKLQKSNAQVVHRPDSSDRGKFNFHVVNPQMSSVDIVTHSKHKKKNKHVDIRENSRGNTDISKTDERHTESYGRPHNIRTGNMCNCNHCETTQNTSSDRNHKTSQQHFLKQPKSSSFHPFGHIKSHNNIDNDENEDQGDKVKNKIMSVLNNVKYDLGMKQYNENKQTKSRGLHYCKGWTFKTKTNFQEDSPIFLLGKCYHKRPEDDDQEPGRVVQSSTNSCMESFKQDFQSRLWFTYRKGFTSLPNTRFTTDCGWGCMLRSGQMMLAQALLSHFVGREWRVHNQAKTQETYYRQIIRWFGDSSSDQCPFSVHRLSELGKNFGKQPGEWYGPSSVAYILRDAVNKSCQSQPILKDICIYVAQDCTVYKQDVEQMCTARPRNFTSTSSEDSYPDTFDSPGPSNDMKPVNEEWNRSVIILIPVRLGGEEFNPIYSACVKNLIAQDNCLGMIGGKPKHSLYFIGWQEDKLIYLDPHFCQDYVDTLKRDFLIQTFHCVSPKKISISKMDPSATIGFYCKTRADFQKFVEQSDEIASPPKGGGVYPMFVFNEGRGCDLDISDLSLSVEKSLRVKRSSMDKAGRIRSPTLDSDEYVVL